MTMGRHISEEAKMRCVKALTSVGVDKDVCDFFADAVQCEYDMTHATYRMLKELREIKQQTQDVATLSIVIQTMSKSFLTWKSNIDCLSIRRLSISPLQLDQNKLSQNPTSRALCSLLTDEVKLTTGEELVITDVSQPNKLKVRNEKGEEGFVPALSCVLPSPDASAVHAMERLQLHLLLCWLNCEKKVKLCLLNALMTSVSELTVLWTGRVGGHGNWEERVSRRLKRLAETSRDDVNEALDCNRLHKTLSSLENELLWRHNTELTYMIAVVGNLDKAVLSYQAFRRHWRQFRRGLLESTVRPIRLVQIWDPNFFNDSTRNFRYYEVKLTSEETVIKEETTNVQSTVTSELPSNAVAEEHKKSPEKETFSEEQETFHQLETEQSWKWKTKQYEQFDVVDAAQQTFSAGSTRELVDAEQVVSIAHEENKKFYVRSVLDPRTGTHISITEAVDAGIIDYAHGLYIDPTSEDESCPIATAISDGRIVVDHVRTTRTPVKTESIGIITIRTQTDTRQFSVVGVVDAVTGDSLSPDEGQRQGLLNLHEGYYVNKRTGQNLSLDEAIEAGLVVAEFDSDLDARSPPPCETKTYAVSAVVDQVLRRPVPFLEAVKRGLIDRDTGCYINNATGQRVFAGEAIRRGLFKCNPVTDPKSLIGIDATNRVVVDRIDRVRKNVLREVKVVSAFKQALAGNR